MIKNGQSILVTGGAGYIGSHMVVQLLQAGFEVVVFDNLCNSDGAVINRIAAIAGCGPAFVKGDVRDRGDLRALFDSHRFDAVIHFAGLKAVGESSLEPLKYYDNNVSGSIVLFEEMARANVKALVFSSSATVYGEPAFVPITESFPLKATNPYGQSKLMVERILHDLYKSDESWKIALLRYFNPAGAHESGLIGENPRGKPNNLIPFIAQVAAGKQAALQVFGADYPTHDGTGVRDYIHVDDLASAHLAALNYLETPGVITINLGTGRGYSVLEIVEAFSAATGKQVPYRVVPRRTGDIATCYADPTLAEQLLGWKAKHGIERMCIDTWRWQSMNPTGFKAESKNDG